MTPERILAGRYQLLAHLARGGMADVFEAEDMLLRRRVAVKTLHQQFASDHAFVQRFKREAQRAANLSHPNIVGIYDSGQDHSTYFIVMELIEGRTLRDVLRSEGALLPRRAAEIAAEVAAALEVAHRAGVIHRDEKPGNIMLTRDGAVKVADFGISRAIDDSEELTKTGAVIGTATYFSPEQAQGAPADERSDIYSLGVVMYEMLTGVPPFAGESTVSVAYQHVSEYAAPPSSLNHDVPPELDSIVMTALEKSPEDRYQTAAELRNDLLSFLRGERSSGAGPGGRGTSSTAETRLLEVPPATVPPDETARHISEAFQDEPQPGQSLFVIGIIALVAAAAVVAFLLFRVISGGSGVERVTIPETQGRSFEDASTLLQNLDLKVRQELQADAVIPQGNVIGTNPAAGEQVEVGSFVTIIVSTGPEGFPMKNLVGETQERALELIRADSLEPGEITTRADPEVAPGIVLEQVPGAGEQVAPGARVDLVISAGPDSFIVPPLNDVAEPNARFQLAQAGMTPDVITITTEEEFSSDVLKGFVIRTEPPAGSVVQKGDTILLVISKGEGTVEMPDLKGNTLAQAQQTVEGLGLLFRLDPNPVPVQPEDRLEGRVAAQNPQPGLDVQIGSTVVVALGEVPEVVVPNLVGQTEGAARNSAGQVGLRVVVGGNTPVSPGEAGTVVSQDIPAGSTVKIGTTITVVVGIAETTTTSTP